DISDNQQTKALPVRNRRRAARPLARRESAIQQRRACSGIGISCWRSAAPARRSFRGLAGSPAGKRTGGVFCAVPAAFTGFAGVEGTLACSEVRLVRSKQLFLLDARGHRSLGAEGLCRTLVRGEAKGSGPALRSRLRRRAVQRLHRELSASG